jgi:tight adherence protein C
MDSTLLTSIALLFALAATALCAIGFWRGYFSRSARVPVDGDEAPNVFRRLVTPIGRHFRPTDPLEFEQLSTRLLAAGYRNRNAMDRFCEDRVFAMLAGVIMALFIAKAIGGSLGLMLSMLAILLGISGPRKALEMRAAGRREAIAPTLPGAVDLLTTCIDAGLTIEHAMMRVARELDRTAPLLATEFQITASEFEAGVSLPDALRRLGRRVDLDELSALCAVVAQAHGLGAPIGQTMREYAASSRRQRTSMLEERAGKLAAQLTLPLALFLLPASMMMILGPAMLQLVRALR